MKDACIKYNNHGFACLPTKADKSPLLKESWNNGFTPDSFLNSSGIGIICGKLSGGLECLDFDNHQGDAKTNLSNYLNIPEVKEIYEKYKLPVETSKNGGYHLLFRCSKNEGNRKLASRLANGRPDAFIESRGEGGYFCAYPTEGYRVIRNDIYNINTITEIERAVLIDNAISLNEFFPSIIKTEYESGDRPGDIYNNNSESVSDMKSLLLNAGWKQVNDYTWRRPGKNDGISATLGKVAANVFFVFTSNAYPFEPMKAYTPFQVLGLLKFNGDFKQAALSIAPEKKVTVEHTQITISEIEKILNNARIDTNKPIEKPPTILSIKEQSGTNWIYKRLFTLGNFSCIIGKAKSRKTFVLSMLTAALLSVDKSGKFVPDLPTSKKEVLYFDTEQGEYDCYNVVKRIETMAGTKAHLKAYGLRQFSPAERCQIIEHAFKLWGENIAFCVIDGVADLATAINDELEATRVSTMLLRLTKVNNCHISTVIHQNKNDNFATGHLGSSIMKKAEILLSVSKSKNDKDRSEVSCDLSRGIDFEPFEILINKDGIPEVCGMVQRQAEYKPAFIDRNESFDESDWDKQFNNKPNF